ncbi:helix-turn-helix transcriptional regulator [Corynebacterium kalidii]|uniref:WYL domain-containing protein n=1 Tax=Corynebacterium kalidii TaxID=2931982 RepID=A0A9X1WFU7_9CORY|nr:WYL domain-containing protein [Corynebacterium kalidii]MCJ7857658.1 WYL domain-containing protein [Corynebacterium kalidii]
MSKSADRLFRLLSLLEDGSPWTAGELASAMDVPGRTLRRDIASLKDSGYDVTSTRGRGGHYRLNSHNSVPVLPIQGDEAVAVVVSLHAAAKGVVGINFPHRAVVRAKRRLRDLLSPEDRRQADTVIAAIDFSTERSSRVSEGTLSLLARAIRESREITFSHVGRGGQRRRSVEPARLVNLEHRWYLHGWDRDRRGWRTFRLDRISGLATTSNRFVPAPLPEGDIAEVIRGDFHRERYHSVTLDLRATPTEAASRLYRVDGVLEPLESPEDGTWTRYLALVESFEELLTVLVLSDLEFTVVDPPEFRAMVRESSARFHRAVTGPHVQGGGG